MENKAFFSEQEKFYLYSLLNNSMEKTFYYIIKELNLIWNESINTAHVTYSTENKNYVSLSINKNFFNSLNPTEKKFVVIHELSHILLDHGKRTINILLWLKENKEKIFHSKNYDLEDGFSVIENKMHNNRNYCFLESEELISSVIIPKSDYDKLKNLFIKNKINLDSIEKVNSKAVNILFYNKNFFMKILNILQDININEIIIDSFFDRKKVNTSMPVLKKMIYLFNNFDSVKRKIALEFYPFINKSFLEIKFKNNKKDKEINFYDVYVDCVIDITRLNTGVSINLPFEIYVLNILKFVSYLVYIMESDAINLNSGEKNIDSLINDFNKQQKCEDEIKKITVKVFNNLQNENIRNISKIIDDIPEDASSFTLILDKEAVTYCNSLMTPSLVETIRKYRKSKFIKFFKEKRDSMEKDRAGKKDQFTFYARSVLYNKGQKRLASKETNLIKGDNEGKKDLIYLFLDVSGSCINYLSDFIDFYMAIPKNYFTVKCFIFATYVAEIDGDKINNNRENLHILIGKAKAKVGGGTNLNNLEYAVCLTCKGKYPNKIMVVTDLINGNSFPIKTKIPKNWYYFLVQSPEEFKYFVYKANIYDSGLSKKVDRFNKPLKFFGNEGLKRTTYNIYNSSLKDNQSVPPEEFYGKALEDYYYTNNKKFTPYKIKSDGDEIKLNVDEKSNILFLADFS